MDKFAKQFEQLTAGLWSNNNVPNQLYHYTNVAGGFEIIKSNQMWASSYQCMNDNEEFIYGFKLAIEKIIKLLEQINWDEQVGLTNNWADFLSNEMLNPKLRPYILSFNERCDNHFMFERYADDSRGLVLQIDKVEIKNNDRTGCWVKVTYDESQSLNELDKNLDNLKSIVYAFYDNIKHLTAEQANELMSSTLDALPSTP